MEDYLLITKETIEQNLTNLRLLVFEVTDGVIFAVNIVVMLIYMKAMTKEITRNFLLTKQN